MSHLSTHVLDTAHGRPAAGLRLHLQRVTADGSVQALKTQVLNSDGRTEAPLLVADDRAAVRCSDRYKNRQFSVHTEDRPRPFL